MPTIKTIKPDGTGDYTTLAAWEDFADGEATADQWAECYTGGDMGQCVFSGWTATADATTYPKIYAAAGHEATDFSTGAYCLASIVNTSGPLFFGIEGIRVTTTGNAVNASRTPIFNKVVIDANAGNGLNNAGWSAAATTNAIIKNCLIRATGHCISWRTITAAKTMELTNNTLVGTGNGIDFYNGSNTGGNALVVTAKNNVAIVSGTSYLKSGNPSVTYTASNNASSDGTATSLLGGSNNQTNITAADSFNDESSSDYTPKTSGALYLGGVSTSNTTSLTGNARHSTPDIGAYETAVATTVTPTGGLVLGGVATQSTAYTRLPTGGLLLDGVADRSTGFNRTAEGGVVLGGIAERSTGFLRSPDGGCVLGGIADRSTGFTRSSSGGVVLGDSSTRTTTYTRLPSGGTVLGGESVLLAIIHHRLTAYIATCSRYSGTINVCSRYSGTINARAKLSGTVSTT